MANGKFGQVDSDSNYVNMELKDGDDQCKKFDEILGKETNRILEQANETNSTNILHAFCAYDRRSQLLKKLVKLFHVKGLLHSPDQDGKEPVHIAAYHANLPALKALFHKIKPENKDRTWRGQSAYTIVICGKHEMDSSEENVMERMECLKFLLEKELDINRPDFNGKTPIYYAAENDCEDYVKIILDNHTKLPVALDSEVNEGKNARILIEEKKLYDNTKLKYMHFKYKKNLYHQMLQYIEHKEYQNMVEILKHEDAQLALNDTNSSHTLLQFACETDAKDIAEQLLIRGADANKSTFQNPLVPIHMLLEKSENLSAETRSGLEMVQLLLKHGASLTSKNMAKFSVVNLLNKIVLREHFDGCIKELKKGEIAELNFTSLLPPSVRKQQTEQQGANAISEKAPIDEGSVPEKKDKNIGEMDVVLQISKTSNKRELLLHPVISAFLVMKWHLMRWFFYTNVFMFLGFTVSLYFYIYYTIINVAVVWKYVIVVFLVILTAKEFLEILVLRSNYLFRKVSGRKTILDVDFQNMFDLTLLLLVYFVLFLEDIFYENKVAEDSRKVIFIVAVLLTALGMLFSLEQMPFVNYKISMIKKVGMNIFKTFLLFLIVLIPFAFCFTILYKSKEEDTNDDEPYFFQNILSASFKTMIMMTGEYDMMDSLDFETYPIASPILFLIFVFVVVLICFNLLIGLAVSDIQAITKEAELLSLIAITNHICYIESLLEPFDIRRKFFTSENYENAKIVVNLQNSAELIFMNNKKVKQESALQKLLEFFGLNVWSLKLGSELGKEALVILSETKKNQGSRIHGTRGRNMTNLETTYSDWIKSAFETESVNKRFETKC